MDASIINSYIYEGLSIAKTLDVSAPARREGLGVKLK